MAVIIVPENVPWLLSLFIDDYCLDRDGSCNDIKISDNLLLFAVLIGDCFVAWDGL